MSLLQLAQKIELLFLLYAKFLAIPAISYLFWRIYRRFRYKLPALKELGIFREELDRQGNKKFTISVRYQIFGKALVISKYNRTFDLEKFLSLKDKLSHIFQKSISAIETKNSWFGQRKILIHFDAWDSSYTSSTLLKPKLGEFQLGKDASGKPVFQSFLGGESSLGVFGLKGSGKSHALGCIIESHHLNDYHKDNYDLIIADVKLNDFLDFEDKYGAQIYDCSQLNHFEALIQNLEARIKKWNDLKIKANSEKLYVSNFLNYHGPKPKHFMLVIDEASQMLNYQALKPLGKDADENQKKEYRFFELKRRLCSLTSEILAVHRFFGNIVIISSQSAVSGDYQIDFTNLQTKLLSRGSSSANSLALTGDSKTLLDPDLKNGKWYYLSNGGGKKIQTPLHIKSKRPTLKTKEVRSKIIQEEAPNSFDRSETADAFESHPDSSENRRAS